MMLDLSPGPLQCLALELLAVPPEMLDNFLSGPVDIPASSSHKLSIEAMSLDFLFLKILCSFQLISCSLHCYSYLHSNHPNKVKITIAVTDGTVYCLNK